MNKFFYLVPLFLAAACTDRVTIHEVATAPPIIVQTPEPRLTIDFRDTENQPPDIDVQVNVDAPNNSKDKKIKPKQKKKIKPNSKISTQPMIDWEISSEFPLGDEITSPRVFLNDDEVEKGDRVKPGKYRVMIQYPGHETLYKDIEILRGTPVFKIYGVLTTLEREVHLNLQYDFTPPRELRSSKIELHTKEGQTISVVEGLRIKPGVYTLIVEQKGYKRIREIVQVRPQQYPYMISEIMEAKPRVIDAQIKYDIAFNNRKEQIFFRDILSKISQTIAPRERIRPGKYEYQVISPGYKMPEGSQQITILPGEEPFVLKQDMLVKGRRIVYAMADGEDLINPEEVKINSEIATYDTLLIPGKKYHITAIFKDFKTVEKDIILEPGEGDYTLRFHLIPK